MSSSGLLLLLLMLPSLVSVSVGGRTNPYSRAGTSNGNQYNPYSRAGTSQSSSSVRSRADSIQGPEWNRQKINKPLEAVKKVGKFVVSNAVGALSSAIPFLRLIQPHGTLIAACVNLAMLPLNAIDRRVNDQRMLEAIKYEFEDLKLQVARNHQEQIYQTWASSVFSKPEKHINLAWESYKTLIKSLLQVRTDQEKDKHLKEFVESYNKYKPAIADLRRILTVDKVSFTADMGDQLGQHVNCHEKELIEYTQFINKLIYKGITMNEFYDKVMKLNTNARAKQNSDIAYDVASAMFHVHMSCIINSIEAVKKDLQGMIQNVKHRSDLAKAIRDFLDQTYNRYDWMVIAFISKHSNHKVVETLNKHVLAGFTEVSKEGVTVAVARQVKGSHSLVAEVTQVILECVPKKTLCYKVRETLGRCKSNVRIQSGRVVPVTSTYSALHAYIHKAHDSHNAKEFDIQESVYPEEISSQTPFIYKGECEKSPGVKHGKYVVLIKSDEEIRTKDPCDKLSCGRANQGRCVRVPGMFLAMCSCKKPFYGKHCEKSLEEYQRELQREVGPIFKDRRSRTNGF
ncbi:unnamed protein product [Ophioblennius macclurei]